MSEPLRDGPVTMPLIGPPAGLRCAQLRVLSMSQDRSSAGHSSVQHAARSSMRGLRFVADAAAAGASGNVPVHQQSVGSRPASFALVANVGYLDKFV